MKNEIYFFDKTSERVVEKYYCLNNWELLSFEADDGFIYPSIEHYYQSIKFFDKNNKKFLEAFDIIRNASDSSEAFRLGRYYIQLYKNDFNFNKWNKKKEEVMKKALYFKFTQNENARKILIETGDSILKEDSKTDLYWGGALSNSKNRLGILLMELREKLKVK